MTDLYPKLVLWRSLNGWTWLIDGPPTFVHQDSNNSDRPLELRLVHEGAEFDVVVTRRRQ